jgi:Na+/phosphate symporter
MFERIGYILDPIAVFAMVIVPSGSALLLANTPGASVENSIELQLLLLPLIGAVLSSGGLIMLNPTPETRRIVIGRSIFALLAGVMVPQILGMIYPPLASVAVKPAVLVLAGAVFATVAYVLSKPFTRELYARADRVAKAQVAKLEANYSPNKPTVNSTQQDP